MTKQLRADVRKLETKMAKAQKELDKLAAENDRLATVNGRLDNELRLEKERSKSPLNPAPTAPATPGSAMLASRHDTGVQ